MMYEKPSIQRRALLGSMVAAVSCPEGYHSHDGGPCEEAH